MNHRMYLAGAVGLFIAALPVRAATIFVTTLEQKVNGVGGCSLQEAIYSANFDNNIAIASYDFSNGSPNYVTTQCAAGSGADVIILPSGTPAGVFQMSKIIDDIDNFVGPAANPMITSTVTIVAGGSEFLWVGSDHARAFVVSSTGHLTLRNAYVKGFSAKGGDGGSALGGGQGGGGGGMGAGGAIYVEGGVLTVQNSTFDGNAAIGGNGSLFLNHVAGGGGGLTGTGAVIFDILTPSGGGGGGGARGKGNGTGCCAGGGGGGGGTLTDGVFGGLSQGSQGGINCGGRGGDSDGGDGGNAPCPGGGGGGGAASGGKGGSGNYGGGGGAGGGRDRDGGDGGTGGFGGGGGAGQQGGDAGYGGGGGAGSGIGSSGGHAGRFGGRGGNPSGGGGAALGGAVFSHYGTVLIQNSTFTNNAVVRGSTPTTCPFDLAIPNCFLVQGDNGQDEGGAIFAVNGSLTVQNATISGNTSTGEGAGIVVDQETIIFGNFVIHPATSFTLQNTIISNPSARECFYTPGVAASGSGNLIVNNFGCPGMASSSDPLLGPLQVNPPGNIPTLGIGQNSPAFNAADPVTSLASDQRGVDRPQAGGFDIGALELCVSNLPILACVDVVLAPPPITLPLTVQVAPGGGGTTNFVPGTYDEVLPSVVILKATPQSGYSFLDWSGSVADPFSASTTVVMNAPQTVTANFVVGTTVLGANILTRSGPLNARVWGVNIANAASSPVTAHNTQINSLTLAQVAGAACTPVLQTNLPISAGDLAPGSSAMVNLAIDFTGCATNARFTAQATFAATGGGVTGTMTRTNQFP